jgi:alginate O-acetyltransferase complex protein AlgI
LRDYLYLPLGGNRGGTLRTYRNLMIVMLLGGLWHGANWTFVVWGAYHGLLLIVDRVAQPVFSRLPRIVYQLQTFLLVVLGWVFFRSPTLGFSLRWFKALVTFAPVPVPGAARAAGWLLLALGLIAFVPESWDLKLGTRRRWAVAYAFAFAVAYFFMNGNPTVFLYYQF